MFRLIASLPLPFRVWAFFASRDGSTPRRARFFGKGYGWPRG